MKLWIIPLLPGLVLAKLGAPCISGSDCPGLHEECINTVCHCGSGSHSWGGDTCLSKRRFGETCSDANECLMSGDPHLDCIVLKNIPPNEVKACQCGSGLHYNFASRKCEPLEVKIMSPMTRAEIELMSSNTQEVDQFAGASFREYLDSKFSEPGRVNPNPKKPIFYDYSMYFGPVVVVIMALLVLSICCCFWKIDPRSMHDADMERERSKAMERALADLQLDGHSNFGFQHDDWDCDNVSRHTSATDIVEDKVDAPKPKKPQPLPKTKQADQTGPKEVEMKPHDGATGELKSREVEQWLKRGLDQIEECGESEVSGDFNSLPAIQAGLFDKGKQSQQPVRKIELVETDDCTSIDTEVPDISNGVIMNPADLVDANTFSLVSTATLQPMSEQDSIQIDIPCHE